MIGGKPVDGLAHPGKAWAMVIGLHLAYLVSFMDRTILSLVIEPIRIDLELSDTQIGLLLGLAFGLLYTSCAILFGWAVDRFNRQKLIVAGITFWCVATAATGLTRNFAQIFLARMGVGVGEATLNPAAISLIADYFEEHRRPLAVGVFQMAGSLGLGIALIFGGAVLTFVETVGAIDLPLVGEIGDWRIVFFAVGVPGLLVAVYMLFLDEPARRQTLVEGDYQQGFMALMRERGKVFVPHCVGFALFSTFAYAVMGWIVVFFIRKYDWSASDVGFWFGSVTLVAGAIGAVSGGWLAGSIKRRGRNDAEPLVLLVGAVLLVVPGVMVFTQASPWVALAWCAPMMFLFAFGSGVAASFVQTFAPPHLLGRTVAIYYFVLNLVGSSVGTLIVGVFNDQLFGSAEAIDKSLALTAVVTTIPAAVILFVSWRNWRLLVAR